MELMKRLGKFGAVAAGMLAAAPRVLAQGCAMCYADAAAQSPRAKHQLDLAILTLLVPSVLMFAGVLIAAFRRREHDAAERERMHGLQATPQVPILLKSRRLQAGPAPERT